MDERSSVIIVDNNRVLLNMLKEGLLSEGYRCETTTNAKAALELIGETFFDILVTDIIMPGLDGFELTEKAKKLRPEMAVIIMTGFIDDFSYDRAIEAGASDFIKKPFTLSEIKMRLKHVKLRERLHETVITDELTGICNRKGFFILAEQQLKLANRYQKGIFMLNAVLDNLKAVNDTFGYHEGDQALIDTATILRSTYREADIVARVGEGEFVVMPVGFTGDNIKIIAACLRENIEKYNAKRNRGHKLSIRFDTAYYDPKNPCSVDEFLAYGEKLMYEQKKLKGKS